MALPYHRQHNNGELQQLIIEVFKNPNNTTISVGINRVTVAMHSSQLVCDIVYIALLKFL